MYATIEDANNYVESYYSSTNPLRVSWNALTNDDKQVFLNQSERLIDSLPLTGKPLIEGKAFPREPFNNISMARAKEATCELAVHLQGDNEYLERLSLQKQGVKSYKIGDLSETFSDDASTDEISFAMSLVSNILNFWYSGGGFKICHTHSRR